MTKSRRLCRECIHAFREKILPAERIYPFPTGAVIASAEGAEEWVSQRIGQFGQWLTYKHDERELLELLYSEKSLDEAMEAFFSGTVLGGGMGTVKAVIPGAAPQQSQTTPQTNAITQGESGQVVQQTAAEPTPGSVEWVQELSELGAGKNTSDASSQNAVEMSLDASSITVDMTDEQRYSVLSSKTITPVTDTKSASHTDEMSTIKSFPAKAKSKVEKTIKTLATKLGIINKPLQTPDVEIDFQFSNGGLSKSLSQQLKYGGSYTDFAGAINNLEQILQNAVLIEQHTDKYEGTSRADINLERVYVLFGAYQNGASVIPVQMEIKKSSDVGGRLYVTVAMTKIEADVRGSTIDKSQTHSLISASKYSLSEIFKKINPADKHFLKYLPDNFLTQEQRQAKQEALKEDAAKIAKYKNKAANSSQTAQPGPLELVQDVLAMGQGKENGQTVDIETQAEYDNENDILDALDSVPKRAAGINYNNGNSIQLSKSEYAAVASRISTNYNNTNTGHDGIQFVDRSTDGKDAKMYMYLYRDHGFGSYEIIGRIDYARQGELIEYIRRGKHNGQQINRSTEGISERLDRLQLINERTDSSGGSDPHGWADSGNEPQDQGGVGQRAEDNGRTGGTDINRYDDGGSGVNNTPTPPQPINPTESVGAAPSGFDPNSHLQYQYGTLPAGEKPVRSDDLPVSTDGNNRVSQTAVTVKGAKVTPDSFVDLLRSPREVKQKDRTTVRSF